ncbi:hypothetical protein [Tateyamaria sp.]|uniref:hypothetical protein n=1 Tax=Tateyamaria sp. TaxID=1929288 RepID=UPI00329AD84E
MDIANRFRTLIPRRVGPAKVLELHGNFRDTKENFYQRYRGTQFESHEGCESQKFDLRKLYVKLQAFLLRRGPF